MDCFYGLSTARLATVDADFLFVLFYIIAASSVGTDTTERRRTCDSMHSIHAFSERYPKKLVNICGRYIGQFWVSG